MKNVLVLTGLALSLMSSGAFAQTSTVVRQGTTVATGAGVKAGTKAAPRVRAPKVATPKVAAPKAGTGVNAKAQATPVNAGAVTAPKLAIGGTQPAANGGVCIGGKYFSSPCGKITKPEQIALVKKLVDQPSKAAMASVIAQELNLSQTDAQERVQGLFKGNCLVANR